MSSNPTSASFSISSESGVPTTGSNSSSRIDRRTRSNPSGNRQGTASGTVSRLSRSRPETQSRNSEDANQPRAVYVEKRDRPRPPTGRGSIGISAENPMEPRYDGDETFCCNADGHLICFRTVDSKGHDSWRNASGKFAKAPTEAEWREHNAGGKERWTDRRMQNLGKDMQKHSKHYQSSSTTPMYYDVSDNAEQPRKRRTSRSSQSSRVSSEVGSIASQRSPSVGSRRAFEEISGYAEEWPVESSADIIFGISDAEVTRRIESQADGTLYVEERKRFRTEVHSGIGEAQRVADQLRNDLRRSKVLRIRNSKL